MVVLYIGPPALAIAGWSIGDPWIVGLGVAGWALMMLAYMPTLRLYGLPVVAASALPIAGILYTAMTIDSARLHALGRGGGWKARTYALERDS